MAKPMADVARCTDRISNEEHMMRDYCSTCAPYWNVVALCPEHRIKLNPATGYCRKCRRYYDMELYHTEVD